MNASARQTAMKTQTSGVKETLAQLEACGDEKVRARNKRLGAGDTGQAWLNFIPSESTTSTLISASAIGT